MASVKAKKYLRMLKDLDRETKMEIVKGLNDELEVKKELTAEERKEMLDKLAGSWSDTSENLAEEIIASRSYSDRVIDFGD